MSLLKNKYPLFISELDNTFGKRFRYEYRNYTEKTYAVENQAYNILRTGKMLFTALNNNKRKGYKQKHLFACLYQRISDDGLYTNGIMSSPDVLYHQVGVMDGGAYYRTADLV